MGNFFTELKRRHIYRVAAAYAVLAWVLLQLFNNLTPIIRLPDWAGTLVLVLLAGGFPLAVFFAWMRELPSSMAGAPVTATLTDWALIGVLLAAIGLGSYQEFAPPKATATVPSGIEAARRAAADPNGAVSVAVMPFANLSGDKDQEYFSDGMTDEISGALAKIPDLRVVARSSAYGFKGKDQDARALGKSLGATHLIEGSVRKAGDQLRISAELVRADDGVTVWSSSYDRQLNDVFAIQEDIARAIAASFHMALGLKPGENLVNNRKIDTASYADYLHARAMIGSRDVDTGLMGIKLLEGVAAKNPQFAPAFAELAFANYFRGLIAVQSSTASAEESRSKGEAAARRAVELDPNDAGAYQALGVFASTRGHMLEADGFYSKALSLDPLNGEILDSYAVRLGAAGHLKDALKLLETAHTVDPFSPLPTLPLVQERWLNGQNEEAIALAKTLIPRLGAPMLADIYAAEGRLIDAADAVDVLKNDPGAAFLLPEQVAKLLRGAAAKTNPPATLPVFPPQTEFVYLYAGAPQRVLDTYQRRADANYFGGNVDALVWHPSYAVVRRTAQFRELMKKAGMVAYWRAKGWPEFCRPTTSDDFACS
jgi:TolB-like protein